MRFSTFLYKSRFCIIFQKRSFPGQSYARQTAQGELSGLQRDSISRKKLRPESGLESYAIVLTQSFYVGCQNMLQCETVTNK